MKAMQTVWGAVTEFCLSHQNENRVREPLPMIPTDGEPWLSYSAIGAITGKSPDYISNVVSKHKVRKHPVFSGFTKLSFLEACEAPNE
jgi:hypothetical protein